METLDNILGKASPIGSTPCTLFHISVLGGQYIWGAVSRLFMFRTHSDLNPSVFLTLTCSVLNLPL